MKIKGSVDIHKGKCLYPVPGRQKGSSACKRRVVGNPISLLEVFKAVSGTRGQKVPTPTWYLIIPFWSWLRLVLQSYFSKKPSHFLSAHWSFVTNIPRCIQCCCWERLSMPMLLRNRESAYSREGEGGKEISFLWCLPTLPGISVSGTLTPEAVGYVLPSFWLCENCFAHMRMPGSPPSPDTRCQYLRCLSPSITKKGCYYLHFKCIATERCWDRRLKSLADVSWMQLCYRDFSGYV